MSKKKKDKSDDPKGTKASSSKKPVRKLNAAAANTENSTTATELPVAPKPRRSTGVRKKTTSGISADDIALRAYYIAEHRRNLSLPGDELGDWVEAERQLRKEAGKKSS